MIPTDNPKPPATEPEFGLLLRRMRAAADLTQEALADRARVSARLISDLERGLIAHPRRATADQLADGLGLAGPDRDTFITVARGLPPTGAGPPANAPRPPARIIGREADIAAIAELLGQPDLHLFTHTGPGGVGKTRLALEVIRLVRSTFADGITFVDLAPLRDDSLVLATIARSLGLELCTERPVSDQLTDWIADKRLLIVLDNTEHLPGAAPALAGLLAACPRLTILATSREPLRLRAEHAYAVAPLPLPDLRCVPALDELRRIPSVDLFVRRAEMANHDFTMTAENAKAIAGIVVRLDGLPLAIELAAARTRVLSPPALLARLEHRLPLLTGGAGDLPARQQAMRLTIDWSYDLLTPVEQRTFQHLSVFAGGFTLDAAEAVLGAALEPAGDPLHTLTALVEKCLISARSTGDGEPRFYMLETIREYGLDRLMAAGGEEEARQRHAAWCVDLAEQSEDELLGAQQAVWFARLDIEHANLRAALGWAIEQCDAVLAARLGGSLRRFWNLRGHSEEGRRWLEQTLAIGDNLPPALRAKALLATGVIASRQGDYARTAALEEARALYRSLDDHVGIASALGNLGLVAQAQGDVNRGRSLSEDALAIFRAFGMSSRVANQLENLGLAAYDAGELARAQELLDEALSIAYASGNRQSAAFSLNHLARVAHALGDDDRAVALQEEGFELWRQLGSRDGLAHSFENFALIAFARCQPARAVRLYGAAESLRATIGAPGRLIDRETHARMLLDAHRRLGEPSFRAARDEGRTLPLDVAIAYALEQYASDAGSCPLPAGGGKTRHIKQVGTRSWSEDEPPNAG